MHSSKQDQALKRLRKILTNPKNRVFIILISLIVVLTIVTAFIFMSRPRDERIPTAPKMQVRTFGIDLSSWQDPAAMDYKKIAMRIDFAILRAGFTGHGTGTELKKDNAFETHYRNFNNLKVPLGVYWYSCADTAEKGIAEAKEVLRLVKGKNIQYPIFWDTEDEYFQIMASREQLTEAALAFCQTIEAAGYKAGVYSHAYWLRERLDLDQLQDYAIWMASYERYPARDIPYDMLQFTDEGVLAGYDGPLDLNYGFVDFLR